MVEIDLFALGVGVSIVAVGWIVGFNPTILNSLIIPLKWMRDDSGQFLKRIFKVE